MARKHFLLQSPRKFYKKHPLGRKLDIFHVRSFVRLAILKLKVSTKEILEVISDSMTFLKAC